MPKGLKSNKQRRQENHPEEDFHEKEVSREEKKPEWFNLNRKSGIVRKK